MPETITTPHKTNLSFCWSEDGFTDLLHAGLLAGRSLKRLRLLCGNGMIDLLTTTSSLPPISSLPKLFRNYSPEQNLALSSLGGQEPSECVVSLLWSLCALAGREDVKTTEVVWLHVCKLIGAAAGMQKGVTQHIIHTHLLPPHSQVTLPDWSPLMS